MTKTLSMLLLSTGISIVAAFVTNSAALAAPGGESCRPALRTIFQRHPRGSDAREDAVRRFLQSNPGCSAIASEMAENDPNGTGVASNDDGNGGRNERGTFILIPVNAGGAGGGSVSR